MMFNQEQQEVIDSIEGAFLISAPVGTGKTTVLSQRVVRALDSGFLPEEILCLTFTNRAAEEMVERISVKVSSREVFNALTIKTFHGFCAYFIKSEAKRIGLNSDFVIFQEEEQVEVMREILEKYPEYIDLEVSTEKEIKELIERVYKYRLESLELEIGCKILETAVDDTLKRIANDYKDALAMQNALDFNELVLTTIRALYTDKEINQKWSKRYKLVQLDEFQDTHLSEYLVVKELAKKSGNVSFIGDLDQTIYSWRGSEPYFIKGLIKQHFPLLKEVYLKTNYRFNPNILGAVKSFLTSFAKANTTELNSSVEAGGNKKCIDVFSAYDFHSEIDWVVNNIKKIKDSKEENNAKIVVLARANYLITKTAEIFKQKGVSHITVDKYEFFRKQEIKDIYACLKIIFNRFDLESAYRLVKRPARNIGPVTIKNINDKGRNLALRVSDFLNFRNYNYPEPYYNIIHSWQKGRIIVLDTETTGTNPLIDEVIQIFAIEIIDGKKGEEFYYDLKNTKPVGASEEVHGLSDEYLKQNGHNPQEILLKLKDFIGDSVTVGHNVLFDLSMLSEYGKRLGIDFEFKDYYDTLDMARRTVESHNYKLGTLVEKFNLEVATHDARDDVMATVGLLEVLINKLKVKQSGRVELFKEYSKKFIGLASLINSWQAMVNSKRPAEALLTIWEESGLKEHYAKDKEAEFRQKSIDDLAEIFRAKDDLAKRPEVVLKELIQFASLVRDINFLGLEEGRVPIVTAHQVKGLEFDYVFIIGLNEYSFPIYKSDLEEEKRLFYVALTRAKKKIFLSSSQFKENGLPQNRSQFIDLIDPSYINFLQ